MDASEKYLYHQVHPFKLAVDIGGAFVVLILLWHHLLAESVAVAIIPSVIASVLLMRYADLEPYRDSSLGRYLAKYMDHRAEALRLLGFLIMAVGAWFNEFWPIGTGLAVVLIGWANGLILPRRAAERVIRPERT